MILTNKLLDFCKEHEGEDVLNLTLQASKYPDIDIQKAAQQIKGLQIAKHKLPTWYSHSNINYPPHLALEQCSSEQTALYKAKVCGTPMESLVDLTGGFGIDTSFLSKIFNRTIYVEQQLPLCTLANYNFHALGIDSIEVINADAVDYLTAMNTAVDMIYIDPARRDIKGRKTVLIEDCTPNLLEMQPLLDKKSTQTMIKLSPMLDISLALKSLTNITDVHIVSVNNECKELLFIKEISEELEELKLHCVNLIGEETDSFTFSLKEEQKTKSEYTSTVEQYLYEPNSSIMKAGAYKTVASRYDLKKLHVNSHLYTSGILVESFPGRIFEVKRISSLNTKEIKRNLSGISQANVSVRNLPMKSEELKNRLKLKDGGDIYIFGTTLFNNKRVILICDKLS